MLFSISKNAVAFLKAVLTLPALLILALLAVFLSLGLAGMSSLVGERIFSDVTAWKQTLWGTVCLSLACAFPLVGWFLLLPYAGFVGVDAVILGCLQRDH